MVNGPLDDLHSGSPAIDVPGDGLLALQSFVHGEEVGHLVENVGGQVGQLPVAVVAGVGEGNGDDLFVILSPVSMEI